MSKRKRIAKTLQSGFSSRSEKRRIGWQIQENEIFPIAILDTGKALPLRKLTLQIRRDGGGIHERKLVDGEEFKDLIGREPELPEDIATPSQIEQLT